MANRNQDQTDQDASDEEEGSIDQAIEEWSGKERVDGDVDDHREQVSKADDQPVFESGGIGCDTECPHHRSARYGSDRQA